MFASCTRGSCHLFPVTETEDVSRSQGQPRAPSRWARSTLWSGRGRARGDEHRRPERSPDEIFAGVTTFLTMAYAPGHVRDARSPRSAECRFAIGLLIAAVLLQRKNPIAFLASIFSWSALGALLGDVKMPAFVSSA